MNSKTPYFILIVLAVMLMSFGIWHAPLPFGDEGGYINDAIVLNNSHQLSINPYIDFYKFILAFINSDPVHAHYISRLIVSLVSALGMWLLLDSFNLLRSNCAKLITIAFWISSYAVTPKAQFGNVSLFTFDLILIGIIPLLRKQDISRILFFLTMLLWACQIRTEYYISFTLAILYFTGWGVFNCLKTKEGGPLLMRGKHSCVPCHSLLAKAGPPNRGLEPQPSGVARNPRSVEKEPQRDNHEMINKNGYREAFSWTAAISALLFAVSISLIAYDRNKTEKYIEHDSLLIFGQHYASYYVRVHKDAGVSAMAEYKTVLNKMFNTPKSVPEALKNNPAEAIQFLANNFARNCIIVVPALLRHRPLFIPEKYGKMGESVEIALILAILSIGAFMGLKSTGFKRTADYLVSLMKNSKLHIMILLSFSMTIALVMLIPDTRYYLPIAPIIFIGIAFLVQILIEKLRFKMKIAATSIIFLWLCHPYFIVQANDHEIVFNMREQAKKIQHEPVIAGLTPASISTFAFGISFKILPENEFSMQSIRDGSCDFIVVNKYFRESSFWLKDKEGFVKFEKNPDEYGYALLGSSNDRHEMNVYVKRKIDDPFDRLRAGR